MDRKIVILIALLSLIMAGCKENKWADWKVQNEFWLNQNAKEDGVKKTSTGLQYRIVSDPTPQDARPNTTSTIVCDYKVRLINGYQVDGGNYVSLALANCIPGFAEGCRLIHNNGDIQLFIPCYLGYDATKYIEKDAYNAEGYGTEGTQSYIPPYSTLIYEIHLCGVIGD